MDEPLNTNASRVALMSPHWILNPEREESGHPTKCLREAAHIMGRELHSWSDFAANAVIWLSKLGEVRIEYHPPEQGDDREGWSVTVNALGTRQHSTTSGGYSLNEALCGAIHALALDEELKAWDALSDEIDWPIIAAPSVPNTQEK